MLRYLAEAGLLGAVTDISAVPGGSLAAAKLAAVRPSPAVTLLAG